MYKCTIKQLVLQHPHRTVRSQVKYTLFVPPAQLFSSPESLCNYKSINQL